DSPDESRRRLIDENGAAALAGRLRAGKDVIRHGWIAEAAATQPERDVVGLAPHHGRVDAREKWSHRKILGHEEIVYGAVRAGDIAVKRDSGAQYDAAHLLSTTPRDCAHCASPYKARRRRRESARRCPGRRRRRSPLRRASSSPC